MPLTATQAQTVVAHLAALRHSLATPSEPPEFERFEPAEVLASLIYEMGPHITPFLADQVNCSAIETEDIEPKSLDAILTAIDEAEDCLLSAVENDHEPSGKFKEILAQLLEKLGPFILQALVAFLLKPEAKERARYARIK